MKYFTILEPPSEKFIEIAVRKAGWDPGKFKIPAHFQEDYFLFSKNYPIFVVADGVTLELDKNGNYPNPSGAGEAAKIFCEEIVRLCEKKYEEFGGADTISIFKEANKAVGDYNEKQGRTKEKINFWDFDLFAATGAFVVVKNKTVYWASICDSYVIRFDKNNSLIFQPPNCWQNAEKKLPPDWKDIELNERKKIIRKVYRNGINEKGELIGYGVITGEEAAKRYLNYGKFSAEGDDMVAILTDGFENYIILPEFLSLFRQDWNNLESRVKQFTNIKSKESPEKFGHERTLIMILF
jgi:hypothetical protein